MHKLLPIFLILLPYITSAQIAITIHAKAEVTPISPYLYGRNNSFSSTDPNWTLPEAELVRLRDAGVRFFRESGGNNSSKYNWRRKLSSHPDWYNNVYVNNWDNVALTLQKYFPNAQGMWAFPLLGYAANTNTANFADWDYNRSQWWEGVNQNLAGGGTPNTTGTKAKQEGNINLYLEKWPADSSLGILNHWFGPKGIGLKKESIRYWNMDNEPEIWSGTHDDVMPKQITAQEFMQRYIELATKARALDPDIKLVGPVTANEWQWYNWDGKGVVENGKSYPWLEYFIKSIAEEQKKSGMKLLDVLDIHFYPATKKTADIVQLHRVFFDKDYIFPEANGVKTINGGYDNSINREYIFTRCNAWLAQYLGTDHGVTLGLTETGIDDSIAPSVTAVWYASTLGEFMKNGVAIFTPWTWKTGMWETLHLLSRYNQSHSVQAELAHAALVSAYPSVNAVGDSLTVLLINRSEQSETVNIRLNDFLPVQENAAVYTLSGLPASETFVSHTQNALKKSGTNVSGNLLNLSLPGMSVTSIVLRGGGEVLATSSENADFRIFPNPGFDRVTVKWDASGYDQLSVIDKQGRIFYTSKLSKNQREKTIDTRLASGVYLVRIQKGSGPQLVRTLVVP